MNRELDNENRFQVDIVRNLQEAFNKFVTPSWFGARPRPRDVAEFCEIIAQAKHRLALGVGRQFPELTKTDFTITNYQITYPPPTNTTPAEPEAKEKTR